MTLSSPVVSQPLSDWTQKLHVTGALPGAIVLVRATGPNPRDIATSPPVGGGSDWIDFLPGVSLEPGDQLQARQELGADASDWTPPASSYPVGQSERDPNKLMAVTLNTFPWECGQYVLVTGAEPGATIEVFLGGIPIGKAEAPLGWARFGLTSRLTSPGTLRFLQTTPIGPGPTTTLDVQPLPLPPGTQLPPPQLARPLHGCEDQISLTGIYDGATLTLNLSTGESYSAGADVANPTFVLPAPLKWDALNPPVATFKQAMPACERTGLPGTATVGPPEVGPPTVLGLCKGNPRITVAGVNDRGLVTVRVFLNGAEFRTFSVHGESVHSCDVDPPLDAGAVYAVQEICGQTSPPSATSTIDEHPAVTAQPKVIGPLYACARSVKVTDVHVGAEVRLLVKSSSTGAVNEVQRKVFLAAVGDFDVNPVLKQDDEVWVEAIGCGSTAESLPHETVWPHPPIDPPKIPEPVENESTSVVVVGAIPTATVYVYVSDNPVDGPWELAGIKQSADGGTEYVALNQLLKTGQRVVLKTGQWVAAAQYFCEVDSGRGQPVQVVKQRPLPPKLQTPTNGAKDVPTTTTFTWSDPGALTDRKADNFDIAIFQGASQVVAVSGLATTSYTIPAGKLKIGTLTNWSVQGRNSTGLSGLSQASFTTLAPKPLLLSYDQATQRLKDLLTL